jgi:hypothetical protein
MHGTELLPSGVSVGITFSGDLAIERSVDEVHARRRTGDVRGQGRRARAPCLALRQRRCTERIADKLALEADLRRAIGAGQLSRACSSRSTSWSPMRL